MRTQVAGILIHSQLLGVNYFTLLLERHQSERVPYAAKIKINDFEVYDVGEVAAFVLSEKHINASFIKRNDVVTEVRLDG